MQVQVERRRLGRRVSEPYFKLMGGHGRELLLIGGALLLVILVGHWLRI